MALVVGEVRAGEENLEAVAEEGVSSDKSWSYLELWDHTTLYENEDNPVIQKIKVIGRYHGQSYIIDSNRGSVTGWDDRRLRPGLAVSFFNQFRLVAEVNLNGFEDFDSQYIKGWDNVYVDWTINDDLKFRIGRQKSNTSRERFTSSRFVLPFNRSRLVLQSTVDKVLGASVYYNISDKITVQTGIYSDLLDGKFARFENSGSVAALMKLGYKANEETQYYLDYWWSDRKEGSKEIRPYRHVLSLNSKSDWGKRGLITDLMYVSGNSVREGEETLGVVFMPWVRLTPKIRGVFRYHMALSNSEVGVDLQPRYETLAVTDGGGRAGKWYNSFYTGIDYQLNGEKLKVMAGIEYSNMSQGKNDYSGWTQFLGIRTWW
ncbi:MAG: OprO/OprP family phosphate-selective porin [Verrucomicrobiales bacterium]|nr:OprO/OprP family phosphate-selective porin [Verrucomicrobiales bacterium]